MTKCVLKSLWIYVYIFILWYSKEQSCKHIWIISPPSTPRWCLVPCISLKVEYSLFQVNPDYITGHCDIRPEENDWENWVHHIAHEHIIIQVQETQKNLHLTQRITDCRHFIRMWRKEGTKGKEGGKEVFTSMWLVFMLGDGPITDCFFNYFILLSNGWNSL